MGKEAISNFTKDGLAWPAQSCDAEVPRKFMQGAMHHNTLVRPFCPQGPLLRSSLGPQGQHHMTTCCCFPLSTYPTPGALPSAFSVPSSAVLQVSSLRAERGVSMSLASLTPDCSIQSYPVSQHGSSSVFHLQTQDHAPVTMSSVPGSPKQVPRPLRPH